MIYEYNNEQTDWMDNLQEDDVVQISGRDFLALIRKEGAPKGRKPISVDSNLFDDVVDRWKAGEITAKEAMQILNLKPNTFYRRIKERTDTEMKDIKEEVMVAAKAGKEELKSLKKKVRADAKEAKADIKELRKHVKEEAKEIKEVVSEKKQIVDMEREIRIEKISAELKHNKELDALRDEVSKEAEAFKNAGK